MSSLKAFLNPIKVENKEIIISKRFVEDGEIVPFIIKPITQKDNETLIKKYTKADKKGNITFNETEYVHALSAKAVVFPNLEDAELQKAYGVLGNVELLKTMLLVGEFVTLSQEVKKLSGIDDDINEDIEDVKNE